MNNFFCQLPLANNEHTAICVQNVNFVD